LPPADRPVKRILIVDDSRMASLLLTNVLEAHGYAVETVSRGEDAVSRVAVKPPLDLILMDIELAGVMDGVEAAFRVAEACDVPIVFLTAHSSKEVFEKIKSSHGYGFVVKGTDVYALLSTIEMALSLHQANAQASFYQKILEDSLNEIYVFDPDDFRILMANRGLRQNLGYSMSELSQMTAVDFHVGYNTASFQELLQPLYRAHAEKVQYRSHHLRKDGTSYPVETHIQRYLYGKRCVYTAIAFDLSELRQIEQEMITRDRLLTAVTETAVDAIVMLDEIGRVVFWNPGAQALFGYSRQEVEGQELHRLLAVSEESYSRCLAGCADFQRHGTCKMVGRTVETKARHRDGHLIDIELSLSAVSSDLGWRAVGVARDITLRKRLQEELLLLSITDPLTRIFNRRYVAQKLDEEVARVKRYQRPLSVIMLDIDLFKRVNDTYGHAVGDDVLRGLATAVKSRIRQTDIFGRWGGEEFLLVLPDTNLENAARLAEDLRLQISSLRISPVPQVTASFGVTSYRSGDTVDTLVQRADDLMYEAKAAGRNRVCSR